MDGLEAPKSCEADIGGMKDVVDFEASRVEASVMDKPCIYEDMSEAIDR